MRCSGIIGSILSVATVMVALTWNETAAQTRHPVSRHAAGRPQARPGAGGVYQQFRGPGGVVIRWIADQMPLKVYIAPGTSLDSFVDPQFGAPYTQVDNRDHWPDLVASVVSNPAQLQSLPTAEGYIPEHYQAAVQGIRSWAPYGSYNYQIVQDPSEADIFVFWTNHFVNKMGLALFENDIRGYTAKRSFPYQAIMSGKKADFKPVVTLLRTVDGAGNPMPPGKMQASAAHEFGHALGIEGHSNNPIDLMSVYYGRGTISPNDAATIRTLYSMQPDYIP